MMIVIGIVGGIGSGKTTVAAMFRRLGARLIDADAIAHEVLLEPEVLDQIESTWGSEVVAGGSVDRALLAEKAFSSREQIDALNAIVHPRVLERIRGMLNACGETGGPKAVVLDAPLLLETGLGELCDVLVYVDAQPEAQEARSVTGKGISGEEIRRREKFQIPLDKKRQRADYIVDNNKPEVSTSQQVSTIWGELF